MFFFPPRRRWSAQRFADLGAGVCLGAAIAVAAQVKGEGREVPSPPEVRSQPPGLRATALSVLDGDTFEERAACSKAANFSGCSALARAMRS
ncbi:hypothetical protein ACIKTA_16865, partial [Hansschlegelia beijingensis]